ncbi:MMPL family transporter [Phytohabitans flavus]|uniref:Membrane protein n=1 Tax=Phytohabitans flavus TaxID=1076124 RepID=A0A6F8XL34_9ACTN|nr:MMPL family transporter [Phytohabitans flavus]BCB74525.1 membrane protein [Phytohabitans flavus]
MARYLYRLGRFAFQRRRLVAAIWVGLLAVLGVAGATMAGTPSDEFAIPGTESQQAIDLLGERFPEAAADGAVARVVFAAPDGRRLTDPAYQQQVQQVLAMLRTAPQVSAVSDPFGGGAVSPDGSVAFAQVRYVVQDADLTEPARAALSDAAAAGRAGGLIVEMGGGAVEQEADLGAAEILGIAVAAVVLVVTFGSLIAAGLPLLTALLGIAISLAAVTLATRFVDLSADAPALAMMIGIAVAIDYALFIVSRYRQEVRTGRDHLDAAGTAVGTAGSAVVFAGLTVIVVLSGLTVVNIPILTQMGLTAAFAVAVAVVIALTLLPAMFGFTGRRIAGSWLRGQREPDPLTGVRPTMGARWARFVVRRPVAVLLVAAVGLGVLAVPAMDLRLGLPDDGTAAPDTTRRKAYDLLTSGFGPGFNGPLTIAVDAAGNADPQGAARQIATALAEVDGVVAVADPVFNQAGDTALLTAVPASGPSSAATEELVAALRETAVGLEARTGTDIAVTGQTAIDIDMSHRIGDALPPYLAIVVGLAFILLMLVFRSILVPLKATLGFLLSVAATFGAVVAVFQWGWLSELFGVAEPGPIMSALPIFLIGLVFGLAMDYQVFLVTRMREEHVHGAEPSQAIVSGFTHSARVVTAAAVIMIAVFSGFMLAPNPLIKSVGFALSAAVLFDAFVVRMAIVPAVMALIGRAGWWLPRWLDRLLPDVDVEGQRLERRPDPLPEPYVPPREPETSLR